MNKININTSVQQSATSDQLDAIAHDYLGVQTSLDDESYGCRATDNITLPDKIKATDGIYQDTKEAFAALSPKVTVNGTEYVRVADDAIMAVLDTKVTKTTAGKITVSECASITSVDGWFQGNTNVIDARFLASTNVTSLAYSSFGKCSNLKVIKLPSTLKSFGNSDIGSDVAGPFYGTSLTSIDLMNVTWVGSARTFSSSLKEIIVRVPFSTGNMYGGRPFDLCSVSRIVVEDIDTYLKCSYDGAGGCASRSGLASLYLISDPNTPLGTADTPLTIPSSITTIQAYALYNLQSCVNLHYQGTVADWLSVTKGTDWHYNIGTDYIQCTDGKAGLDDTTSTGNTYE